MLHNHLNKLEFCQLRGEHQRLIEDNAMLQEQAKKNAKYLNKLNAAHEKVKEFKFVKSKHAYAKGNERKEEKKSHRNQSWRRF